ncbi:YraN family protein [Betaproteobacteria bacterium GR16-43]|nr:YraN family protein [Betaproteobacteria bacterium GR16-43]
MPSRATGRRTSRQVEGGEAEERAAQFLAERGMTIVARNFSTRLGEIDLVARDGGTLVFVEVRRRLSSARYGGAIGSIDERKQRRIVAAARLYLARLGSEPPCRFDVIALEAGECHYVRDAFAVA